jgi:hypothetical protein
MKRFAAALILMLAAGASSGITVASYGDNSIANTADTVADLIPNDLGQVLDAADLVIVVGSGLSRHGRHQPSPRKRLHCASASAAGGPHCAQA